METVLYNDSAISRLDFTKTTKKQKSAIGGIEYTIKKES